MMISVNLRPGTKRAKARPSLSAGLDWFKGLGSMVQDPLKAAAVVGWVLSDVDLALYLKNPRRLDFLSLFGGISQILGTDEIDLVILNTAPISLTGRILQKRKILADKDPFLRHQYESRILREFFNFTIKEKEILHRRYGIGR